MKSPFLSCDTHWEDTDWNWSQSNYVGSNAFQDKLVGEEDRILAGGSVVWSLTAMFWPYVSKDRSHWMEIMILERSNEIINMKGYLSTWYIF